MGLSVTPTLLYIPEKYADYVIAHEITHIYMFQKYRYVKYKMTGWHGSRFWSELESFLHGAQVLDKELDDFVQNDPTKSTCGCCVYW